MSIVKEFKEFAVKGNVMDMAVGIIIGVAFGKIVSSFVADVMMPPIGLLIGGVDFSNLVITLKAAEEGVVAVTVRYGVFIQSIFDFVIVAFAVMGVGVSEAQPGVLRRYCSSSARNAACTPSRFIIQ